MVLCLAMMLSIMVVGAGAAFADQDQIDSKHQEAVDMCAALNIITGFENGKFMPNDNVTREQMAKMICFLDNGGKEPQLSTGNTFTEMCPLTAGPTSTSRLALPAASWSASAAASSPPLAR